MCETMQQKFQRNPQRWGRPLGSQWGACQVVAPSHEIQIATNVRKEKNFVETNPLQKQPQKQPLSSSPEL